MRQKEREKKLKLNIKEEVNKYIFNKGDIILFKEFINAVDDIEVSGIVNLDELKKQYIMTFSYTGNNELDKLRFFNIVKLLSDIAMQYSDYIFMERYSMNGFNIDQSSLIYDAFVEILLKYDNANEFIKMVKEKSREEYSAYVNGRSLEWFKIYSNINFEWSETFNAYDEYDIQELINDNGYKEEDRGIIKEKFFDIIKKKKMAFEGEWKPLKSDIKLFEELWTKYINIIEKYDFDIITYKQLTISQLYVIFYVLEILEGCTYKFDMMLLMRKEQYCTFCESNAMIFNIFLNWVIENKDNKALVRKGKMKYI